MNLETKKMTEEEHTHMMQFGWTIKDVYKESKGHGRYRLNYLMARDKDREHYDELVKLEREYRTYKNSLMTYKPMDEGVTVILYLCFLIPGIIYTVIKAKQKSEVMSHNDNLKARMKKVSIQAQKLL